MNTELRRDGLEIVNAAIRAVLPDEAVRRALEDMDFPGRAILVAAGKASWQMAKAACEVMGDRVTEGIVLTKYDHSRGPIADYIISEGGHPVPDNNSFEGTARALEMTADLNEDDTVLFLLSGGGSALFEKPLIPAEELEDITSRLLACGADIVEINTVRKRLSAVKGGRFAQHCYPARVFSVILSDILGDPLDMIASGPTAPDSSTCAQAESIVRKYAIRLFPQAADLMKIETPKSLDNAENIVRGSVRELCVAAAEKCRELGYRTIILTDRLCCEARDAGSFLASIAVSNSGTDEPLAFIAGGETVVHLTGTGLGGRNQELALAASEGISGHDNILILSAGSDGTDGPTDAAGGIVDGDTFLEMQEKGYTVSDVLKNNDAYHALQEADSLIMTGPTGTNVNDVSIVLIRPQ